MSTHAAPQPSLPALTGLLVLRVMMGGMWVLLVARGGLRLISVAQAGHGVLKVVRVVGEGRAVGGP